jgi:hypothetical protein
VKASNFCTIAELPKASFVSLIQNYPSTLERIKLGLFNYKDHVKTFLLSMCSRMILFDDL